MPLSPKAVEACGEIGDAGVSIVVRAECLNEVDQAENQSGIRVVGGYARNAYGLVSFVGVREGPESLSDEVRRDSGGFLWKVEIEAEDRLMTPVCDFGEFGLNRSPVVLIRAGDYVGEWKIEPFKRMGEGIGSLGLKGVWDEAAEGVFIDSRRIRTIGHGLPELSAGDRHEKQELKNIDHRSTTERSCHRAHGSQMHPHLAQQGEEAVLDFGGWQNSKRSFWGRAGRNPAFCSVMSRQRFAHRGVISHGKTKDGPG